MPKIYFRSTSVSGGSELWVSDGTSAGTKLLKDILSGAGSGFPTDLNVVGGKLYFAATDASHGTELWISNGTASGTKLVEDLNAGPQSSVFGIHNNYVDLNPDPTLFNGKTYFFANDGPHYRSLWSTTGSGASLIEDGTVLTNPDHLIQVGSKLFFTARAGSAFGLYTTSGDAGAAHLVTAPFTNIDTDLVVLGGKVYFGAYDAAHSYELWKSDGTDAGTKLVKDINTTDTYYGSAPDHLTLAGNKLFFSAADDTHGYELWYTDGTTTKMVKNIASDDYDGYGYYFSDMVAVGNRVFFAGNDGVHGEELWVSDGKGSASHTHMVKDLTAGGARTTFGEMEAVGSTLFFTASDGKHGTELWRTDGTSGGTVMVKDIVAGNASSLPSGLTAVGANVYFTAWDSSGKQGLWRSDGTAIGTVELSTVAPTLNVTPGQELALFKGKIYFSGDDPFHGAELWQSDGTGSNTKLLKDLAPGFLYDRPGDGEPGDFAIVGGKMYFTSFADGPALWVSDGTANGTKLVTTFNYTIYDLTVFDGKLYFGAGGSGSNPEVFVSDGTASGTHVLKAITASGTSGPRGFTVSGDHLFFVSDHGNGEELYVSDGTAGGTKALGDLIPSDVNYFQNPGTLTDADGTLFFTMNDGDHGFELWKSDGTSDGTKLVKDIITGPDGSGPDDLVAVGNKVYFSATDGYDALDPDDHGYELWVSGGSANTTHIVKDIDPGWSSSYPTPLAAFKGKLVFRARDDAHGSELWITDGSAGTNTHIIKDLHPGTGGTNVFAVAAMGNNFYFAADTGETGHYDLWKSDGTEAGTKLIKSLGSGIVDQFTVDGGMLYFATNLGQGETLWKSDGTAGGTVQITSGTGMGSVTSGEAAATGSASNGANRIAGTSAADTTHAKDGDDFVDGGDGADKLYGDKNNDTLVGGKGDDHLEGGKGDDWLEGGAGQDVMLGDAGKDNFVFDTAPVKSKPDTIDGFDKSDDTLVFARSVFSKVPAGELSASRFVSEAHAKAHDTNDFFLFDTTTKTLLYDADAKGGGAAIAIVTFTHSEAPTAADILII